MGLLTQGTPLRWNEAQKHSDHVRKHGIIQLINILKNQGGRRDVFKWGDEIEYSLLRVDDQKQTVQLDLRGLEIVDEMIKEEHDGEKHGNIWRPEYARYMLEGTPEEPFEWDLSEFLKVEPNMAERRKRVLKKLQEGEKLVSLTTFPLLGSPNFLFPHFEPNGIYSESIFIPDESINTHPRFATLTRNIRERRGKKVAINVPIFQDLNTPKPFVEFPELEAAKPDHIYMDCMCFGMGCCCLQVTFQANNIDEARKLYDQLIPLAPLMLSLSASAPIWRGYLSDHDCRWEVISASVDDRTQEESSTDSGTPLSSSRFRIPKSRYDSVSRYISNDPLYHPEYNDLNEPFDEEIRQKLLSEGLDDQLARHFAHLFIRDPLVIYQELLNLDDEASSDHFENIQSTNWQTIRFKPPPPGSPIGWRVEFRSMELQWTDFENAAYAIFVVLLTRAIASLELNMYMPISKVDENMKVAHKRNSVKEEKFYFRKYIFGDAPAGEDPDACELMSIDEIFNGRPSGFPGLIPLIGRYLDSMSVNFETRCKLNRYLSLVAGRASTKYMTTATYMRKFVGNHPDYQSRRDSVVSQKVAYDLMKQCIAASEGKGIHELTGTLID